MHTTPLDPPLKSDSSAPTINNIHFITNHYVQIANTTQNHANFIHVSGEKMNEKNSDKMNGTSGTTQGNGVVTTTNHTHMNGTSHIQQNSNVTNHSTNVNPAITNTPTNNHHPNTTHHNPQSTTPHKPKPPSKPPSDEKTLDPDVDLSFLRPSNQQEHKEIEEKINENDNEKNNKRSWTKAAAVSHYAIGRTLGEGTFGKVKKGIHKLTSLPVAIKILEKDRIVDLADVERVKREIHILTRIRHPNVIRLYEVIDSPRHIFLIMEYASGGELFDYIVAQGRVKEDQARRFFHHILNGVDYCHRRHIIHRDLKPENLLLDTEHGMKIVDFGLGNVQKNGRLLKTACGSPCYAAPEMIAGKRYHGPGVDMWSLGVILFALLCGYLPFEDANTARLYEKIMNGEYQLPDFLTPGGRDLISKLLCTDPRRRLTADQVRQHSWYSCVQTATDPVGVDANGHIIMRDASLGYTQEPIDQDMIRYMQTLGYNSQQVMESVNGGKHDHYAATYHLLMAKKRSTAAAAATSSTSSSTTTTSTSSTSTSTSSTSISTSKPTVKPPATISPATVPPQPSQPVTVPTSISPVHHHNPRVIPPLSTHPVHPLPFPSLPIASFALPVPGTRNVTKSQPRTAPPPAASTSTSTSTSASSSSTTTSTSTPAAPTSPPTRAHYYMSSPPSPKNNLDDDEPELTQDMRPSARVPSAGTSRNPYAQYPTGSRPNTSHRGRPPYAPNVTNSRPSTSHDNTRHEHTRHASSPFTSMTFPSHRLEGDDPEELNVSGRRSYEIARPRHLFIPRPPSSSQGQYSSSPSSPSQHSPTSSQPRPPSRPGSRAGPTKPPVPRQQPQTSRRSSRPNVNAPRGSQSSRTTTTTTSSQAFSIFGNGSTFYPFSQQLAPKSAGAPTSLVSAPRIAASTHHPHINGFTHTDDMF